MEIPGYHIIESIGHDPIEPVYLAEQTDTSRQVVIHTHDKTALNKDSAIGLQTCIKDSEQLCAITHPNIAKVYAVGETESHIYSITDYIAGDSLADLGEDSCMLDQIYIIKQIAGALDYLADNGYGHFIIKPSNIILSESSGQAMLVDFGFDRAIADDNANSRPDLYRLGIIFYTLLADKEYLSAIPSALSNLAIPEDSAIPVPEDKKVFQNFIDRSIALAPAQRFQSGGELAAALDEIDDEVILAINGNRGIAVPEQIPGHTQDAEIKPASNVVPLTPKISKALTETSSPAKAPKQQTEALKSPQPKPPADLKPKPGKVGSIKHVNIRTSSGEAQLDSQASPKPRPKTKTVILDDQIPASTSKSSLRRTLLLLMLLLGVATYYQAQQDPTFLLSQLDQMVELSDTLTVFYDKLINTIL